LIQPLTISISQSGYPVSNGYHKTEFLLQLPYAFFDVYDPDLLLDDSVPAVLGLDLGIDRLIIHAAILSLLGQGFLRS
jgi:hypothetical protein